MSDDSFLTTATAGEPPDTVTGDLAALAQLVDTAEATTTGGSSTDDDPADPLAGDLAGDDDDLNALAAPIVAQVQAGDPGAAFTDEALDLWCAIRAEDRPQWQRLRQQIKRAGVLISELEDAMSQHAQAEREAHQRSEAAARAARTGFTNGPTDDTAGAPRRAGGGQQFELVDHPEAGSSAGVYFVGTDKNGDPMPPRWLCDPLHILALTRGAKSADWGRLLAWRDGDGHPHRWAVPAELLAGDGLDVRRELMRLGLPVSPSRQARDLLGAYLQSWEVAERARCVDRLGWLGPVFVLPDEAIGADGEAVVFQSASAIEPAYAQAGTADQWRDTVAALAQGNSRMVFAICCAFAPVLAHLVGEDSGGFHLRGKSSSGKSTALHLAASVWGHPATFPRLWRTTANGLEGLAAVHNDNLLILDELSQVDPRDAGDAAYLLANGQGKTRASRAGMARQAARWRLLFLSAGEESLSAMMARAGKRTNAGQEVRLADIEADAGAGLGAFDTLNGHPSGAALSLALKDAAARFHGAVGVAWLRAVVRDRTALVDSVAELVREFVTEHTQADAPGQVIRVARRFGLVAAAGELATGYDLTSWSPGESFGAAGRCFAAWLEGFGGAGNREDLALMAQVRAFFEAHGASRFEDMAATTEQRIINRAGFWRDGDDGARQFLVLPEVFKRELCAGFDAKAAAKALVEAGVILAGKDGKASRSTRLPGIPAARVYVFTGKVFSDE